MIVTAVTQIVALLALASAAAGVLALAVATWNLTRFVSARRRGEALAASPPIAPTAVTILKPLHGADDDLFDCLESCLRQSHLGPVQLVCSVGDARDPAVAIVKALQQAHPGTDIALVVAAEGHGSNRKISNVINAMTVAKHDVLVLADSDIRVDPGYLVRILGALHRPGVGIVTCAYRGVPGGTVWTELLTRGIDHHFLPNVVTGVSLGLAEPCMGSTLALSRSTLERIGGFERFADALADDYEIGRAVRGLGLRLVIAPGLVVHVARPSGLRALLDQEVRWQRTIRTIDPAGFAGSFVTHTLPLAGLAVLLSGAKPWSIVAIVALMSSRGLLIAAIDRRLGWPRRRPGLWIVRDLMSFAVFLAAFASRKVVWRGRRLDVRVDGSMTEHGAQSR